MFLKKLFGHVSNTEKFPFKVIELEQGRQQWFNWRHSGIGASDASTIMGENRFKSPDELLEEKKRKINTKPNEKMRKGTELEPEARSFYQKKTNNSIKPICIQSNDHSWLIASSDGISNDYKTLRDRFYIKRLFKNEEKFWHSIEGI